MVCSHSSRLAFLSGGPYEFLADRQHCTQTQEPKTVKYNQYRHNIHGMNINFDMYIKVYLNSVSPHSRLPEFGHFPMRLGCYS